MRYRRMCRISPSRRSAVPQCASRSKHRRNGSTSALSGPAIRPIRAIVSAQCRWTRSIRCSRSKASTGIRATRAHDRRFHPCCARSSFALAARRLGAGRYRRPDRRARSGDQRVHQHRPSVGRARPADLDDARLRRRLALAAGPRRQPVVPTMRLFRQPHPRDWSAVAGSIAFELRALVSTLTATER
jgi:hypothetical protein